MTTDSPFRLVHADPATDLIRLRAERAARVETFRVDRSGAGRSVLTGKTQRLEPLWGAALAREQRCEERRRAVKEREIYPTYDALRRLLERA